MAETNRHDEGFPVAVVIILLAVIGFSTSLSVFVYTTALVVVIKLLHCNGREVAPSVPTRPLVLADVGEAQSEPEPTSLDEETGTSASGLPAVITNLPESDREQIVRVLGEGDIVAAFFETITDNPEPPSDEVPAGSEMSLSTTTSMPSVVPKLGAVTEGVMRIAISYSGKQRKRVLKIARILQKELTTPQSPHPVFFDQDFQHEVCRMRGVSYLRGIYHRAKLVVVFVSTAYANSKYCLEEWEQILADVFSDEKNKDLTQVLLVKLGEYDEQKLSLTYKDLDVNGLRASNARIAEIIRERLEIVEEKLGRNP